MNIKNYPQEIPYHILNLVVYYVFASFCIKGIFINLNTIAIETAAVKDFKKINYKIMKFIVIEEGPSCKNRERSKSKRKILKPVNSPTV